MKNLFQNLGSLKLAVVMLALLLVGLAAGTIVESSQGTEAAGRLVYYAWWFIALEAVFAVNVACSIGVHFPWGKARAGFLTTHTALLVILIGASVSYFFKQEAHVEMWEGATSNELPFAIKLDRFTIERYQGTTMPANFRSDVEIDGVKHAIWMNHPLEHNGWTLFQSSYKQEEGRSATILAASKDPGQPIVFFGYGLLVLGMCAVLTTRILANRARQANVAETTKRQKMAIAAGIVFALMAGSARAEPLESLVRDAHDLGDAAPRRRIRAGRFARQRREDAGLARLGEADDAELHDVLFSRALTLRMPIS